MELLCSYIRLPRVQPWMHYSVIRPPFCFQPSRLHPLCSKCRTVISKEVEENKKMPAKCSGRTFFVWCARPSKTHSCGSRLNNFSPKKEPLSAYLIYCISFYQFNKTIMHNFSRVFLNHEKDLFITFIATANKSNI